MLGLTLNTHPVSIISVVLVVRKAMSIVVFDARAVTACKSKNIVKAGQKLGLDSDQGSAALMPCLGSSLLSLLDVDRSNFQASSL